VIETLTTDWWTISPRGYDTPSSQCFYHWVDTSTGGLLVLEFIIHASSQCFYHWVDTSTDGLLVVYDTLED
jgi:hypothetical protein